MKTAREASKKYTEKSLQAFLEGRRSENWALGILRASMPEDIELALRSLSFYNNTPRFELLKRACGLT